jgi:hypothetical protein
MLLLKDLTSKESNMSSIMTCLKKLKIMFIGLEGLVDKEEIRKGQDMLLLSLIKIKIRIYY